MSTTTVTLVAVMLYLVNDVLVSSSVILR